MDEIKKYLEGLDQRCPICGLRPSTHIDSQTIQQSGTTITFHYYSNDSTEQFCFGHSQPEQVAVPQAFYDAFTDGDTGG